MEDSEAIGLSDLSKDLNQLAMAAAGNGEILKKVMDALDSDARRERQRAAKAIGQVADENLGALVPYVNVLVDAVDRPEAQTRWEVFEVLTKLVSYESRACDKALAAAETSLFDEESGPVRLAAMRFLCKLGATTENRSEKVWPLLDEAIQCYHGDQEFQDMLIALIEFSAGKLTEEVKGQLAARMSFDANNGRGVLKRRAAQIVENVSK